MTDDRTERERGGHGPVHAGTSAVTWAVVLPVKRLTAAKSRLRGAVPAEWHAELALAMLCDTVTAVLSCPRVDDLLVITDDPAAGAAVAALGARVVPDRPAAGLNAAVRFGADRVAGIGRHRAVLAGDLPALRPAELDEALGASTGPRSYVADAAGSGTVLLAVAAGVPLAPRFGVGSAAAHASAARGLTGDWPGLRHDVDTPDDLRTAVALGVGAATCGLLRTLGIGADCGTAAGATG